MIYLCSINPEVMHKRNGCTENIKEMGSRLFGNYEVKVRNLIITADNLGLIPG
jgi:hypothetical protein